MLYAIQLILLLISAPTSAAAAHIDPPCAVHEHPCFAEERVWIPGRWVSRYGRRVWEPGRWTVRQVRIPCPPPPCPPPPPRYDRRYDDRHRHDDRGYRDDCRPPRETYVSAMSPDAFAAALGSINSRSFEDGRLTLARQVIDSNWLTSAQVRELMSAFSFEQSRMAVAKAGWHRVVDPERYFMVNDGFSFDSSVRELDHYMRSAPR